VPPCPPPCLFGVSSCQAAFAFWFFSLLLIPILLCCLRAAHALAAVRPAPVAPRAAPPAAGSSSCCTVHWGDRLSAVYPRALAARTTATAFHNMYTYTHNTCTILQIQCTYYRQRCARFFIFLIPVGYRYPLPTPIPTAPLAQPSTIATQT